MSMSEVGETPTPETSEQGASHGADTSTSNVQHKPSRKPMKKRSKVFEHFSQSKSNPDEAACQYCGKVYCANTARNGTRSLLTHLALCKENPHNKETQRAKLSLQPSITHDGVGEKMGTLVNYKYDETAVRLALSKMVVLDELPLKFVEGIGFKLFCAAACPRLRVPSRWTIGRDIYKLYLDEKLKLKDFLKSSSQFVCITTDTWTSIQKINYMVLTVHWIDNDWKLNKRILNFVPITSNRGEDLGRKVEGCLQEWEIEKVLTITVDNASSNDVMISYLKRKLSNWGSTILQGQYLHMRCIAHIVNLVVQDGFKENVGAITRIRNAVRYVRQSPARWAKWNECCKMENIDEMVKEDYSGLCLDVPTRWNSTYLMLNAANICRGAFERFEVMEPSFRSDFEVGNERGMPNEDDWDVASRLCIFLRIFYKLTLCVSGTLYVTSDHYFHQITNVECTMLEMQNSLHFETASMARRMKEKYDKYWGDFEKMNIFIFVPIVFDPRYKMGLLNCADIELYKCNEGDALTTRVGKVLEALYKEYQGIHLAKGGSQSSGILSNTSKGKEIELSKMNVLQAKYMQMKAQNAVDEDSSELKKYLAEENEPDVEALDILQYWKLNSGRFPILSMMARDILAIPLSTVASDSAFSTGGRVLDCFRSSLQVQTVQTLICTQDWIRASFRAPMVNIEEEIMDAEKLERDMGGEDACIINSL